MLGFGLLIVSGKMNFFNTILILAAAFLAVFAEAAFQLPRQLFGAQVDLLPALMIYAALNTNIVTVSLLAVLGGSVVRLAVGQSARRQHPAAVCRRLPDLPAARFDFARAAVRPGCPRRRRQRGRAGAVRFAVVDRRPGAVAGLGFALAMAGDDRRRRGWRRRSFSPCSTGASTRSATSRKLKPVSVPTAKSGGEENEI